jgi:hypothetical protein
MNELSRSLLSKLLAFPLKRPINVPSDATEGEKLLVSSKGPIWSNAYVSDTDEVKVCNDLSRVLDTMQAARIIVGNNGGAKMLRSRCSGHIIMLNSEFVFEQQGASNCLADISPARDGQISCVQISYMLQGHHLNEVNFSFLMGRKLISDTDAHSTQGERDDSGATGTRT